MQFTSPRTTTFIQTLLSAPITTSPITCADSSTYADGSTVGTTLRYGRSMGVGWTGSEKFDVFSSLA